MKESRIARKIDEEYKMKRIYEMRQFSRKCKEQCEYCQYKDICDRYQIKLKKGANENED